MEPIGRNYGIAGTLLYDLNHFIGRNSPDLLEDAANLSCELFNEVVQGMAPGIFNTYTGCDAVHDVYHGLPKYGDHKAGQERQ